MERVRRIFRVADAPTFHHEFAGVTDTPRRSNLSAGIAGF